MALHYLINARKGDAIRYNNILKCVTHSWQATPSSYKLIHTYQVLNVKHLNCLFHEYTSTRAFTCDMYIHVPSGYYQR